MITYETSVNSNNDPTAAIAAAKNYFTSNDFRIEIIGKREFEVTGPGMNSNKQNPIRGVSKGRLTFSDYSIEFNGELGGVQFMKNFLYFFPPGLGLFLGISFAVTSYFNGDFNVQKVFLPLIIVVPWLILSPLMAKSLENKTQKAIDTLLYNIANT